MNYINYLRKECVRLLTHKKENLLTHKKYSRKSARAKMLKIKEKCEKCCILKRIKTYNIRNTK